MLLLIPTPETHHQEDLMVLWAQYLLPMTALTMPASQVMFLRSLGLILCWLSYHPAISFNSTFCRVRSLHCCFFFVSMENSAWWVDGRWWKKAVVWETWESVFNIFHIGRWNIKESNLMLFHSLNNLTSLVVVRPERASGDHPSGKTNCHALRHCWTILVCISSF